MNFSKRDPQEGQQYKHGDGGEQGLVWTCVAYSTGPQRQCVCKCGCVVVCAWGSLGGEGWGGGGHRVGRGRGGGVEGQVFFLDTGDVAF